MDSPSPSNRVRAAAIHASMLAFLRVEIQIANTMLDAAATTRDETARERRQLRANEACGEVSRYLEQDADRPVLQDSERQELVEGLRAISARMDETDSSSV